MRKILVVLFTVFLASCAAPRYDSKVYASGARSESALFMAKSASAGQEIISDQVQPSPDEQPAEKASARMVYYQGYLHLRSTQPSQIMDSAEARVRAIGGRVEKRDGITLVLLVPAPVFRNFFDSLQNLGTVQNRNISAEDITEAFEDNELRIRIHRSTLDRLKQLLAASTNDDEKGRLLGEISRITEALLTLENRKRILESQAAFSRVTLFVQPFIMEPRTPGNKVAAFTWMENLRPRREESSVTGCWLKWRPPANMLKLDLPRPSFGAAASDGTQFWTLRRENEPRGDALFWHKALRNSLQEQFAAMADTTLGEFKVLRLESHGLQPYVWYLAVTTRGRHLDILQAFFPDRRAEARHRESVFKAIMDGRP